MGHDRRILNHVPADLDPPYMVRVGDDVRHDPFVFYVAGDHYSEAARNTIPPDAARDAVTTSRPPASYLRWAMLEATMHALRHPVYSNRYQRNKARLGRQRGAKVAQIDIARKLTEAVWQMLTRNQRRRFSTGRLALQPDSRCGSRPPMTPGPPNEEAIER